MNNLIKLALCFSHGFVLAIAGCQQPEQSVPVKGTIAQNVIRSNHTNKAVHASNKIQADCVVSFFNSDSSFYVTQQHHIIEPLANSITITTEEPTGKSKWQLSKNSLNILQGSEETVDSSLALSPHHFAKAILTIFSAPTLFMTNTIADSATIGRPIRIKGDWYYPIQITREIKSRSYKSTAISPIIKKIFYQNRASSLIDTVWFAGEEDQIYLTVRGYNYQNINKTGELVPAKIEIFATDISGKLQKRLVKIDYHTISSI